MKPKLKPGVRLHWDKVRQRWVLLAPERIVELDETAKAILDRIDGDTGLPEIAAMLAAEYDADPAEIAGDAEALVADLRLKGYVA